MKVGIIGAGAVAAATAMSVLLRGIARDIVIVNRNRDRAKAMAADMRYGAPLFAFTNIRGGDYEHLSGASLLILTSGVNEKSGGATDRKDKAGRLKLLEANVKIFADIVPRLAKAAPAAPILVLTDPPDPLVSIARHFAGHNHVLATGTYLDSLRFRIHIAARLNISPESVEANVLGEHGTSSVFLWSGARIAGVPLETILQQRGIEFSSFRDSTEKDVREANIAIIEGIGASQYGIGMVASRVAEMILRDENTVIPISAYSETYGAALSLPGIVGRNGVSEFITPGLSTEEAKSLEQSAETIKQATANFI